MDYGIRVAYGSEKSWQGGAAQFKNGKQLGIGVDLVVKFKSPEEIRAAAGTTTNPGNHCRATYGDTEILVSTDVVQKVVKLYPDWQIPKSQCDYYAELAVQEKHDNWNFRSESECNWSKTAKPNRDFKEEWNSMTAQVDWSGTKEFPGVGDATSGKGARKNKKRIDIVIPFRNRQQHFAEYRENFRKHISKYGWDARIIVVEQDDNSPFRRGWLLNVGLRYSICGPHRVGKGQKGVGGSSGLQAVQVEDYSSAPDGSGVMMNGTIIASNRTRQLDGSDFSKDSKSSDGHDFKFSSEKSGNDYDSCIKSTRADCVITSDVDMLANLNVDFGDCDEKPTQFCSEIGQFNYTVPYETYAGGVVGATPDHWLKFNGFSNKGKGWGGEDDVLYNRIKNEGLLTREMTLRRPQPGKGRCESLTKGHTERTKDAKGYSEILEEIEDTAEGKADVRKDGITTVDFVETQPEQEDKEVIWLFVRPKGDPTPVATSSPTDHQVGSFLNHGIAEYSSLESVKSSFLLPEVEAAGQSL